MTYTSAICEPIKTRISFVQKRIKDIHDSTDKFKDSQGNLPYSTARFLDGLYQHKAALEAKKKDLEFAYHTRSLTQRLNPVEYF